MGTDGGNRGVAHPPTSQPPRNALNYSTKRANEPISLLQVFGGFLLSFIICFAAILLSLCATRGSAALILPIGGAPVFGIIYWAVGANQSKRYRGLAMGIWIGLELALLLFVCLWIAANNIP